MLVLQLQRCWATTQDWQMGTEKGCYEKMGIYSARLNGVGATTAFDSRPGSGHSAVVLETAPEGDGLSTRAAKWKTYPGATGEEGCGSRFVQCHDSMISAPHLCTLLAACK